MFCPRHPKVQMTESGRHANRGEPIMHCLVCIKMIRAKLAPALEGRRHYNGKPFKQVVLPPVRMPWY